MIQCVWHVIVFVLCISKQLLLHINISIHQLQDGCLRYRVQTWSRDERRSNHYMFWQIHFADNKMTKSHKRGRVEKLILYCIDFRGKFLFTFDRTKYRILILAHNNTFIRVTIVSCNALQQYMNCVYWGITPINQCPFSLVATFLASTYIFTCKLAIQWLLPVLVQFPNASLTHYHTIVYRVKPIS